MAETTKEQLQEEILEILYQKNLQKPVWVTAAEIYWSIQNIKVTERSVQDALDRLVKNDVVLHQSEKYQLSKREFLEMSKRKGAPKKGYYAVLSEENKTTYVEPVRKPNVWYVVIALLAFLLSGTLLGILFFNNYARDDNSLSIAIEQPDSLQLRTLPLKVENLSRALSEQQKVNREMLDLLRMQQEQIHSLAARSKLQVEMIEQQQKEMRIYLWLIGATILVLSSLFIGWYGSRS